MSVATPQRNPTVRLNCLKSVVFLNVAFTLHQFLHVLRMLQTSGICPDVRNLSGICPEFPEIPRKDPTRIPQGSHKDPARISQGSHKDPTRIPQGSRKDPARIPQELTRALRGPSEPLAGIVCFLAGIVCFLVGTLAAEMWSKHAR